MSMENKKRRYILFCLSICNGLLFPKNYYVSPAGSDTHLGTSMEQALKSIKQVNTLTLLPGDSVLFERNGTYLGQIELKNSGLASSYIVLLQEPAK
jgi:hypothetical protein